MIQNKLQSGLKAAQSFQCPLVSKIRPRNFQNFTKSRANAANHIDEENKLQKIFYGVFYSLFSNHDNFFESIRCFRIMIIFINPLRAEKQSWDMFEGVVKRRGAIFSI